MSSEQERVLGVHRALYDAVETGDAALMEALWVDDPETSCVHPGAPMLRGAADVVRSWIVLMAHVGYIQFFLTDVEVAMVPAPMGEPPSAAVVTCTESILSGAPDDPSGLSPSTSFGAGTVTSTSILVRNGSEWRFWLRHASPVVSGTGGSDA